MTYIYRNKTSETLWIPGVGKAGPGETIETDRKVNNKNFELVKGEDAKKESKTEKKESNNKDV